ncbi:hypothetical protein UB43_03590 [Pseudomonas sp. 21]|uniref:hypothetical protein n=1 Tax=Pseudomonas sp. 21 TaxID=1619948 RepID=UPI0005EB288C|nr:hypothetical protein [Pseudomonas sp. 21]KJK03590.1 hypothetical protein UB43_03590 [Pseudomonas sp. 21]
MQAINSYGLIIVLLLASIIQVFSGWIISLRSEAKGYDKGYDDAKRGNAPHIEALHEDLALLRSRLRLAEAEHTKDRENLMQDCDKRIAHYSRQANPFTEEDAAGLMKTAGQLRRANELFEHLGATTEADYAFSASNHATVMAGRIREAIAAANEGAPSVQPEGAAA